MKLIKFICIALCLLTVKANGMERHSSMPFRVGFEFQLNGRLCEWALDNYDLQKKPIFKIKTKNDIELFHVELDGPDIEIVTKPFSHQEINLLTEGMTALKAIIDKTKVQLEHSSEINFQNWLSGLSEINIIKIITTNFFDTIKEHSIKKLNPHVAWEPSWQPQITIQHPLPCTILLCNSLFPTNSMQPIIKQSIPNNIASNTALAGLLFLTTHEMVGMTKSYLMPLNRDYLLKLAIALDIYFHGQNHSQADLLQLSINALSDSTLIALQNNPKITLFLKEELPQDDEFIPQTYTISNLKIFLNIANDARFMYKAILMKNTLESFNTAHQSDAKRWTNFMSRRPFSHMFQEIRSGGNSIVSDEMTNSYLTEVDGFLNAFNKSCGLIDELSTGFYLANYAEQFYGEDIKPLDLRKLIDFFDPIIKENNYLSELLRNGMLSTTMFSLMNLDKIVDAVTITDSAKKLINEMLVPEYYRTVLSSIEQPQERKFLKVSQEGAVIKIDAQKLSDHDSVLDLLSPPFPLDGSDSMGQYRKGVFNEEYNSRTYGSAIVEFRNIQQAKGLKAQENNFDQTGFLTLPDCVLEESLSLFKLLSSLTILD